MRAIPSPTWSTVPTSSSSDALLKLESCSRNIADTSAGFTSAILFTNYGSVTKPHFEVHEFKRNFNKERTDVTNESWLLFRVQRGIFLHFTLSVYLQIDSRRMHGSVS